MEEIADESVILFPCGLFSCVVLCVLLLHLSVSGLAVVSPEDFIECLASEIRKNSRMR